MSLLTITVSPFFAALELFALGTLPCALPYLRSSFNFHVRTLRTFISPRPHPLSLPPYPIPPAYRVRIFNEVIHAIVSNPSRLLSTVFLGAIAMWTFMLLGVAFFWDDYSFGTDAWGDVCSDFRSCFGCVGRRQCRPLRLRGGAGE